ELYHSIRIAIEEILQAFPARIVHVLLEQVYCSQTLYVFHGRVGRSHTQTRSLVIAHVEVSLRAHYFPLERAQMIWSLFINEYIFGRVTARSSPTPRLRRGQIISQKRFGLR